MLLENLSLYVLLPWRITAALPTPHLNYWPSRRGPLSSGVSRLMYIDVSAWTINNANLSILLPSHPLIPYCYIIMLTRH